uniref:methyltransferase type 11 n=1 Tax=Sulfolobus sp. NOB8H2 TaxID=84600 RepID=UPI0021069D38|nr:methyltransferase type 11 [Sulfolobus sp. NOB8H2]
MFLGLMILLAAFSSINYFYQSPNPPTASGNIQYGLSSYNITISPHDVLTYAEAQNFTPLSDLTKDNFIPILKYGNTNIITAIKKILSLNASLIAPVPYWEAEDLAQFLNASFVGYKILHSYTIPLSPNENESWTQNYLSFNITKFNITVYNNSYAPSTNISYSLSIINKTIVFLKGTSYNIWPGGSFSEEGFYNVYGNSYSITSSYPFVSGNELVFVPAQTSSSGLIYFSKNLYITGGVSVALIGGATESNTPTVADGFYIGIAYGHVSSWAFNTPSVQKTVYGSGYPYSGSVAFPANTYAIVVQYDPLGPNINFFISDGSVKYEISYVGLNVHYSLGQLIYFNVTLDNGIVTAYVSNLNTGQSVKLSVSLTSFYWYPNLQSGLYTIYLGGATGTADANWYIDYSSMYYYVPYFIQNSTVFLQGNGYTYNGTVPLTWLQNNSLYYILRKGDGPYSFSLKYIMLGNQSYSEFVKVFANDTLEMLMRYYNIIINRNYTGLVGWINATPIVIQNQYGGLNYTLKFKIGITKYPVPEYVVNHPPAPSVFRNNYAFEYLEWSEYRLLAQNIYNFTIQFTENVTQHLNYNYTKFWRAEAYAITVELLSQNIHDVSTKYQHQYPVQALWDGNGTQYEANINLALILENLMPVNVTIGQHYNVTNFYPVSGYWISNWSYDYINVQNLPQYWLNNTVFLQSNYTYLSDIGSTYRYFTYWQIPNGTYNNVTLYNPLPFSIIFHYGTYYLTITPIEFYNITFTLKLVYNDSAEYKIY